MADAWETVVDREPAWNDNDRSRAFALDVWEGGKCPTCNNYDVLVPITTEGRSRVTVDRDVVWDQHDNRVMRVRQFRCLACGAVDAVRRDFNRDHENDKPAKGRAAPSDGRIFMARPLDDEED